MERFLWICFAGALGTGARYLVSLWAAQRFGADFPFGTLFVNVAGCFLIALVVQAALSIHTFPPNLRLALTTGFMGGLTTYSSFNYETTKLLRDGSLRLAFLNFALTVMLCFVAGLAGMALCRRLLGT